MGRPITPYEWERRKRHEEKRKAEYEKTKRNKKKGEGVKTHERTYNPFLGIKIKN